MSATPVTSQPANRRSALLLRSLVGDPEFSIVSNNCWGAHVYQALELPYRTPFVGLFIPARSYLNLLRNFRECINSQLLFAKNSGDLSLNSWRQRERLNYPIGLLCREVEIHFLHYGSEAEASTKWQRRCERLVADPDRIFFKFDDRGATKEDIAAFDHMRFRNKVCFTAGKFDVPTIIAPAEAGASHVSDGIALARMSRRYFNTLRWLSTRPAWLPLPSLL